MKTKETQEVILCCECQYHQTGHQFCDCLPETGSAQKKWDKNKFGDCKDFKKETKIQCINCKNWDAIKKNIYHMANCKKLNIITNGFDRCKEREEAQND